MHHTRNPNLIQELDARQLKQELDTAHRQLEEHAVSIASLYNELRKFHEVICPGCKEKVWCRTTSSTALSRKEIPRPVNSGYRTLNAANLPPSRIPIRVVNPRSPRILRSVSVHQQMTASDGPPQAYRTPVLSRPTSRSTTPMQETSGLISTCDVYTQAAATNSSKPNWSIVYNQEVKKGIEINPIRRIAHQTRVYRAKFSKDGAFLGLIHEASQIVSIYRVATGTKICLLEDLYVRESHSGTLDISFSPDSKYLATTSGSLASKIRIWDIDKKCVRKIFKLDEPLYQLDFSPNGRFLLSCTYQAIIIWNIRDGSSKKFADPRTVKRIQAKFSPDGSHIVAGCYDDLVLVWGFRSGHLVASLVGNMRAMIFMQGVGVFISGGFRGALKRWDISGLSLTQEGSNVKPKWWANDDAVRLMERFNYVGHTGALLSVSISPDDQWIASGSDDTVRIWNTHNAAYQCILQGHEGRVVSVDFSPAGDYFASAGQDGQVQIWSYRPVP